MKEESEEANAKLLLQLMDNLKEVDDARSADKDHLQAISSANEELMGIIYRDLIKLFLVETVDRLEMVRHTTQSGWDNL